MNKLKQLMTLVVLFLSTLLLTNCENKNRITPEEGSVNTTDIGMLHNKAMDEIFQTLKKETAPLKPSNINAVVKKGFKSFFDKEAFSNKDEMISMSNKHYDNNRNKRYSKSAKSTNEITPELREELDKLDALLWEYITEDRNGSLELFDLSQTSKYNIPDNLIDENSRNVWVNTVDVMGHSAKYWNENYIKWQELFPNQGNYKSLLAKSSKCNWWCRSWRKVRDVVAADASGGSYAAGNGGSGALILAGAVFTSIDEILSQVVPASAYEDGPSDLYPVPLDSIPYLGN